MKKVQTYLLRNILLTLICSPLLFFFTASLIALETEEFIHWPRVVTAGFIIFGIIFSITSSKKINGILVTGQHEEALRYAKRVNRFFISATIVLFILAISIATISPKGFRIRGYNAAAKSDLLNFYNAAQLYFKQNPDGAVTIDKTIEYGFKPTFNVELKIQGFQQMNFRATAAHPNGTKIFTINNEAQVTDTRTESQ